MNFPEVERVVYSKNPLNEVSFKVAYPIQLEIAETVPVSFQKLVRDEFPLTEVVRRDSVLGEMDGQPGERRLDPVYEFWGDEKNAKITLASDYFEFSTFDYRDWEDVSTSVRRAFEAFFRCYDFRGPVRVQTNYINMISRNQLGISEVRWADLIRPELLGPMASGFLSEDECVGVFGQFLMRLSEDSSLLCKYGTLLEDGENIFVIDNTFGLDEGKKIGTDSILEYFGSFRRQAGNAFRWSILDSLHGAMEPKPG